MNPQSHESFVYRMSMHELLTMDIAEYVDGLSAGKWCDSRPLGNPVGAWQTIVGELNRVFVLHREVEGEYQDSKAKGFKASGIQPVVRTVQLLRAVKPVVLPPQNAKLIELRLYTLFSGALEHYVPLLLDALPAREKYSRNVGIWTPITGPVDTLVHIWAYTDANQRAELRPAINADPVWHEFVPKILPMIRHIQSYFMTAIPLPPAREKASVS